MVNSISSNTYILCFKTFGLDVEIHRHSAYQIVYSHDHTFSSLINGKQFENIGGFIIKPQVSHRCTNMKSTVSILNIEVFSSSGTLIGKLFEQGIDCIPLYENGQLINLFQLKGSPLKDAIPRNIIKSLSQMDKPLNIDSRIESVIDLIRKNYHQKIDLKKISEKVFLSSSRLAALFKSETGSSISKFLLWTRMRIAIEMLLNEQDKSITEIAFDTGFYDSANFIKTMHQTTGISPSGLRKNSDLIQLSR